MYPILYRRRTRVRFLLLLPALALCLRLLCVPGLRTALQERAGAVLGGKALLRAVFLLETGTMPEFVPRLRQSAETAASTEAAAPAENAAPTETLAAPTETLATPTETLAAPTETLAAPTETLAASTETLAAPTETLAAPTETLAAPTDALTAPDAPVFTAEEAEAIRFRGNCSYEVDKAALLLRPLDWPKEAGPKLLIIHSHSCEAYTQSEAHSYIPSESYRTLDLANNMIAVGDALAEELAALGVEAIHDRTLNDYPSYNRSYAVAREKIQANLAQYPSLVMVIDLHRDALDQPVRETVERDGKTLAPLMLVIGTDEGGLSHPHWDRNLSCGLKLQALANRDFPGLFKSLSFRASRFNGDLTPGSIIVEVGSTENTLDEAQASMPYLARYVAELLRCP